MKKDLEVILAEVIEITKKAGEEALSLYTQNYEVKNKAPDNPVTQADIESNRLIMAGLQKFNYGILSEAGGRLTDMDGRIFTYNKSNPRNERGYVASNGTVHEAIIEHLNHKI